jgi:hypothetical protein
VRPTALARPFDDAHVEKIDKASKDAEHLEAASKMVHWVHKQQASNELTRSRTSASSTSASKAAAAVWSRR